MSNAICSFCGKEYEGYLVLLCDDIECLLMEMWIKDIYYFDAKASVPFY